jgi:hypothetical protein
MRVDIDKLNQIYADDFATIASSGRLITKKHLLSDFESSHHKLESLENGPMDVQVFGNVAVGSCRCHRKEDPGRHSCAARPDAICLR